MEKVWNISPRGGSSSKTPSRMSVDLLENIYDDTRTPSRVSTDVLGGGVAEVMSAIETDTHVSTDLLRPRASDRMETDTHVSRDVLDRGGRLNRHPHRQCCQARGGGLPRFVTPLNPEVPHIPLTPENVRVGTEQEVGEQRVERCCEWCDQEVR